MVRTYSFEDVSLNFSHPDIGQMSIYGSGLGDVTISRDNNATEHTVASDLTTLVSRSIKKNGKVTIDILQASDANDFLNRFVKYIETADPSRFALAQITIDSRSTGEQWMCTGVSHQKMPDRSYKATGDFVQYTLMAAYVELL